MKVYCISGLGANCGVYEHISLPNSYEKIYLEWKPPFKNENLREYAQRMSENINPKEDFILMGLSFGGIIAQEISQFLKPKKLILISTVKHQKEIPLFFKISKYTKAHQIVPMRFITSDGMMSYAFFRKLYSNKLPKLKEIFTYRDPQYLRWSFSQIVNWQPKTLENLPVIHIHGNKDPLFPIKKIDNPIAVNGGNHLMIILKSGQISEIIQKHLD